MLICLTDISKTANDLLRAAAGHVRGRSICSRSERKKDTTSWISMLPGMAA
jgi:hypothetical protein